MKKLFTLLLLATVPLLLLAADPGQRQPRQPVPLDNGNREIQAVSPGQVTTVDHTPAPAPRFSQEIQDLRANYRRQVKSLESQIRLARDHQVRLQLEERLAALKTESHRAELLQLQREARQRGDEKYAARLQEVLDHGLAPTRKPHAPLPRDPRTGRPLNSPDGEGGVK